MRLKRFIATLVVLVLLAWLGQALITWYFPLNYRAEILENCVEYELNPAWVSAIICAESQFNADAKSHKGAVGLMQIMEETGDWVAKTNQIEYADLYRPGDNIKIGCAYLRMLLDQYNGSEFLALCAYNAGEGRVDKWLEESASEEEFRTLLFEETRNYTEKIENYQKVYKILYWRNTK